MVPLPGCCWCCWTPGAPSPAAAARPERPSCGELSLAQLAPLQVRLDTRTAQNRRRQGLDRRASPEPLVPGRPVLGARHGPATESGGLSQIPPSPCPPGGARSQAAAMRPLSAATGGLRCPFFCGTWQRPRRRRPTRPQPRVRDTRSGSCPHIGAVRIIVAGAGPRNGDECSLTCLVGVTWPRPGAT